jgi:hypothetical protein
VVGEAGVADPPTDRFDVRPASEVYLQSGKFSVEHMTAVLSDNLEEVVAGGLRTTAGNRGDAVARGAVAASWGR